MSAEYPTPEEAFGPGETRHIDSFYQDDSGEPDTREVAEAAFMPLEDAVSPAERLHGDG